MTRLAASAEAKTDHQTSEDHKGQCQAREYRTDICPFNRRGGRLEAQSDLLVPSPSSFPDTLALGALDLGV